MPDQNGHTDSVAAWLDKATAGLKRESMPELLEGALVVLWRRTQLTLGEVTLSAIANRVLHSAAEKYPILQSLKVRGSGIDCSEIHCTSQNAAEAFEALHFVLIEFLTVLGNLTADILTPALHSELSRFRLVPDIVSGKGRNSTRSKRQRRTAKE
jgi:hypothetical protein